MSKVEEKIEKVAEDVSDIKVVLSRLEVLHERNTMSLEEHIRRTNNLEELVLDNKQELHKELEPIKKHVSMVKGALIVLSAVGAIIMGLYQMGILQKLF